MSAGAEFLDSGGAALGRFEVGPLTAAERANATTMLRRAGRAAVPAGTGRNHVTLASIDADTVSSATADNVKLTLDVAPPPPPAGASPSRPAREPSSVRATLRPRRR